MLTLNEKKDCNEYEEAVDNISISLKTEPCCLMIIRLVYGEEQASKQETPSHFSMAFRLTPRGPRGEEQKLFLRCLPRENSAFS